MSDWSFPTNAPADARRSLPVFSLTPNWQGGVLERVEFLTDIMSSEIAVEQRRASRRYPRRSFEASFMRVDSERARIDLFLAGLGRAPFLVPLWHDQFRLSNANDTGTVVFPAGTLQYREFFLNDLVLIQVDSSRYAILTVMSVNLLTDTITLAGYGNVGTWPANCRITPLRRARNLDPSGLGNPSNRVGQSTIRFTLTDSDSRFPASWGYCAPLWRFKPDRATEIGFDYDRTDFVLDFGAGVVDVTDPGNRAQIGTSISLSIFGREEIAKYRAFLYMARGRARRFYIPSFTRDIVPIGDLSGMVFDATVNGFSQYMPMPQEARRIISVVFKDGRPTIYRNIIGIEPVLSPVAPYPQIAERFTLDQSMPPIYNDEIESMTFVMPARFDQDAFEISHVTDNAKAIKAAVVVKSSVVDGMPPIECWVTSLPYPINVVETMSASMSLQDSTLEIGYRVIPLSDALATAIVLSNTSDLRVTQRTTTMSDALATAIVLSDTSDIRVALHTTTMDDALASAIALSDTSDLTRILVTYDRYTGDAMQPSITLLPGGTLS